MQKNYEKEFVQAEKMAKALAKEKNLFKAPKGQGELERTLLQPRNNRQDQNSSSANRVPNRKELLTRLEYYQLLKDKKDRGRKRDKSLEDMDPALAFRLASEAGSLGFDELKKYFSDFQIKPADSLAEKKWFK